jgi:hypothetical protein
MRSRTAEVKEFGVVVRIEQVSTQPPLGLVQRSHIPANANSGPEVGFEHLFASAIR